MKTGYLRVLWSALAMMVITAVTILTVITELSFFKVTPLIYTAILIVTGIGIGLMMRNRFYLPILRNMSLQARLLVSPLALLIFAAPASLVFIYYDLNGRESLSLLAALFTSLAAVFCLAFMFIVTLPSMDTVLYLFKERNGLREKTGSLTAKTLTAIAATTFIVMITKWLTRFDASGLVLLLPLYALVMIILHIILAIDFRNALSARIAGAVPSGIPDEHPDSVQEPVKGFRSALLFADHYLDLISGRIDYLKNHADESYASTVTGTAGKAFDPALLPALRVIASGNQFSDQVRQDAELLINNIEKYYSDPVRNSELLRLPGISEKAAAARSIMLNRREPSVQEIVKILGDANHEIRRTGIIAAGRFGIRELREEVVQAISHPDTAREAFYVLRQFGPDTFGDIIGTALKPTNSEKENLMIMRLLDMMPLSGALPYLNRFIAGGHVNVRLKAAACLCGHGYVPQAKQRLKVEETLNETLHTIARLMALQLEAKRNKYFIMAAALEQERSVNTCFMFSLLTLLTGKAVADVIISSSGEGAAYGAGIAAETIDTAITGSLRRPLKALLGNHTDTGRLEELSLCYPLREIKGRSVASFILASEQNITGTWSKACALHKVAGVGGGVDKELAVSYLFSNSQLLQEESARAIRAINPEWYGEAAARLPETIRNRIAAVVSGERPEASMMFEKTRFLSLCFNRIPEEKIVLLASSLRYSESYDAGSIPGIISWIVPSQNGKSGLYALPVDDIAAFVFYYSEYTDIFVNYMDNQGSLTVH
jgi:hypothetical protein